MWDRWGEQHSSGCAHSISFPYYSLSQRLLKLHPLIRLLLNQASLTLEIQPDLQ